MSNDPNAEPGVCPYCGESVEDSLASLDRDTLICAYCDKVFSVEDIMSVRDYKYYRA